MFLCFNPPTKWQTSLRMKYVLCSVRKGNTNNMMEKRWLCEIFAHSRFIKLWKSNTNTTEKFIKHVLLAKVRAINRLENTNHRTRKRQEWGGGGLRKNFCVSTRSRTRHPLYDNQINTTSSKDAILNSKFKSVPSIPCFLASFHVNVFINYVRLNWRIKFYLNANNAFMQLACFTKFVYKSRTVKNSEIQTALFSKRSMVPSWKHANRNIFKTSCSWSR